MLIVFLLLLPGVRVEETTASNLLTLETINDRPFKPVQFLKKASKKGPILFPNDAPPPPPPPLIVTSRPLIESIRRSELNPNNTIQAQSQINPVTYTPKFLMTVKAYKPFEYKPLAATQNNNFGDIYAQIKKKKQGNGEVYEDYGQATAQPIYKVLSNHANNVLRSHKKPVYEYQDSSPDYPIHQNRNEPRDGSSKEYDHGENYAFSYTVKDHKTGDDFSHSQTSRGAATNGEYRVLLPDGRMQIVSYTADENGYKADVRYDEQGEPGKENKLESEINKNNLYEDNYTNNRYKTNKHAPVFTYNDNQNVDYTDKNNVANIHVPKDHYSDYLLNENVNDNLNKVVPVYNDKTYIERNQGNDYYQYTDDSISKEYKDYSNEFDYQPHKSKYSSFAQVSTTTNSPVKPSYEQLKDIFVQKLFENPRYKSISSTFKPNFDSSRLNIPLVSSTMSPNFYINSLNAQPVSSTVNPNFDLTRLNSVSSTIAPNFYTSRLLPSVSSTFSPNYDATTENIVVIGMKKPKLFTSIQNIGQANANTPSYLTYSTPLPPLASTPSNYLISTITNLKNKISLSQKPELSRRFIDKINQYLSYK